MARPKKHLERRITYGVRLPEDLHKRLSSVAEERETSINQLIVRGVESYLKRLPKLEDVLPS
jgi:predicted HicB family RNase H-like nuclease